LQSRRNINSVAVNVLRFGDYIADIDADAKADAFMLRDTRVAPIHPALHLDRTQHRFDDARELRKHAVAGGFDDPPMVLPNLRIKKLTPMRLETLVRTLFVGTHQARIANNIGG